MFSRSKINLCLLIILFVLPPGIQSCGGGGSADGSSSVASSADSIVLYTGYIYERESDTSYTLDLDGVTPTIECSSISLNGETSACEPDGYYFLQASAPDYKPLSISHSSYIPMDYTVWGNNDLNKNLGLYRTTTVNSRAGFVKGMAFLDLGNTYPPSFWASIIDEPVQRMNAELVSYVEVGFNHGCDDVTHSVSVSSFHPDYPDWRFSTEAELTDMVTNAHAAGLAFNMWLGTINVKECSGSVIFDWDSNDTAFWDDWFTDYRLILLERTLVAKNLGIEWITLGHNMDYVSRLDASRWATVIADMKAIYPGVKIAYFGAAVMSETPPYFESDYYNGGSPDGFASLLDALGHAVTSVSTTANPSRDDIKTSFTTLIGKTSSLSVPIWVMPMTASTTVGASDPTFIEPELLTDTIGLNYTTDFYQQADVYQALFEVINTTPTGNGQVMGVLPWGYHLRDNYRDTGIESNSTPYVDNLIVDRTANVRGKPAESILKWWFGQL